MLKLLSKKFIELEIDLVNGKIYYMALKKLGSHTGSY